MPELTRDLRHVRMVLRRPNRFNWLIVGAGRWQNGKCLWRMVIAWGGRRPEDVVMTATNWVDLVEHIIWPIVLLVLVFVLRRQIGDFLSAIGGRITQVSVMSVTIDLATATETIPPWRGYGGEDVRGLVVAQDVSDSYFDTLRQSLSVAGTADFFVVDLKSDGRKEWLTSRLYLFTWVLSRMKGVRTVVFTATRGDVAHSYLGVAGTEELLHALAAAEPWLRLARLQVEAPNVTTLQDIDEWWQSVRANPAQTDPLNISRQFLEHVQSAQSVDPPEPESEWLLLPSTPGQGTIWEHATWITTSDLTDGMLRDAVQPDSYVLDDRSWSAEERVKAVAQTQSDFVALLGPTRRFERLVDRRSLLEELGKVTFKP